MIKNLEELYSFNYKGSNLDISALLVYIRNKNETEGKKYLINKGISGSDAEALIKEVKTLLSSDSSFANGNNSYTSLSQEMFGDPIYSIDGNRGRHLSVYDDFVVIDVTATVGSVVTGNAFDGQKVIFYADCIGIQYKEPGLAIGYLQLETASPTMNNKSSNFFNENTFTFGDKTPEVRVAYQYIFEKVRATKSN